MLKEYTALQKKNASWIKENDRMYNNVQKHLTEYGNLRLDIRERVENLFLYTLERTNLSKYHRAVIWIKLIEMFYVPYNPVVPEESPYAFEPKELNDLTVWVLFKD